MHYERADVERLLKAIPYLSLAKPRRAAGFLAEAVATGAELASTLSRYPEVRYQALDFHYVCLQSLGALNEQLLSDLLTEYGWGGVLWAALLATLSPDARYRPLLEAARGRAPHQEWALDLALATLAGEQAETAPVASIISQLRTQFADLPLPTVHLRTLAPDETRLQLQELVRKTYRTSGTTAALLIIRAARLALDA